MVTWGPEDQICGYCYQQAKRTRGTCECGHTGVLPGRVDGRPACRACAQITLNIDCVRCGAEDEIYRASLCWPCALSDRRRTADQPGHRHHRREANPPGGGIEIDETRQQWNDLDPENADGKKIFALGDMDADHIVPWSKGGKTDAANGQMLCVSCNRSKGDL
ncbi:HNH endonuclease [Tsukamurella spumae]|uniref:HNH endonuclease n=1 Tax=Tsukamurella spumae TaxID=44753 RepID=UPI0028AD3AA6|nr:HNH endonuclease signature motif containing protein [Tsukamurella spumae]